MAKAGIDSAADSLALLLLRVPLGMALSLVCTGGGKWAVDRMLWRR